MQLQKKLAANLLGVSPKRVKLDMEKLEELGGNVEDFKQSITKNDIRSYIHSDVIAVAQPRGISRGRARKRQDQKRKGRRRSAGSRKGKANARLNTKDVWKEKVRTQRTLIQSLKKRMAIKNFHDLYRKVKGGYFRSRRHLKLYIDEHGLISNDKN